MKICFTMKPISDSFGGGNQFLNNLKRYIKDNDKSINIVYNLNHRDIDIIFILDPRLLQLNKITLDMVIKYKSRFPKVKIIHRVNECDIKREKSINIEPLLVKTMKISNHVVFVSKWLQDYFIKKYKLNLKSHSFIINGVNITNFVNNDNDDNDDNDNRDVKKIKLVTHHFSNNYLKGFHIYNALDKLLESRKDIEFTYIGNYNKEYKPKNIKIIKPTSGKKLGDLLRQNDIYITATQNEPGAMHYLEGMSSGLPILYCKNGGGAQEICNMAGEEYNNIETFLNKMDLIKNNYNDYVNKIDYEYLSSVRCCKEYCNIIKDI
jgi:glycosyltransferase involved in cell wall biosynthesis